LVKKIERESDMGIVHSSHGTLEIDDTGKVTGIIADGKTGAIILPNEGLSFLFTIERFNLKEYGEHYSESGHTEFDILDLGYWTTDGTYEPPVEQWRKQIEEELAKKGE
jgi:hypothetical protein